MTYRFCITIFSGLLAMALCAPALASAPALSGGLGGLSLNHATSQSGKPRSLDRIVAVVNNDIILKSELDAAVAQVKQNNAGNLGNMPENVLRSQVLDQLIIRKLQLQRADQTGIKVSKQDVQQGLKRLAQRNNMSVSQFRQAVESNGLSWSDIRKRIRDRIKITKLRQQEVMRKVSVSDQDVDRYLQNQALRFSRNHQYHLRQILLKLPAKADSTTVGVIRSRLEGLRHQITSGQKTFAAVARTASDGAHAADGGDLGWTTGSALPDSFDAALAGLSKGQVSPVFRGPNGFYLLKLVDQRGSSSDKPQHKQVMVKQVHLRHIIVQPNQIRSESRTSALAHRIRQRLAAGDDFAKLARKYSDDKSTSNQGGDVGWIPTRQLPAGVRQQIQKLQPGQISPVFQTAEGYEIVKLIGRRQRDETMQARRDKARQTLGQQRANTQGQRWLQKLRDQAYVDIRMPNYQPTPGAPGG